jgi:tol-pal system protein YbgF
MTGRMVTGALALAVGMALIPAAHAGLFDFGRRAPQQDVAPGAQGDMTLAQTAGAADRLNRIEAQMRTLTGQIETLSHQLEELQGQLQKMQADNEYRFGELEGGKALPGRSAPPAQTATAAPVAPEPEQLPAPQTAPAPLASAAQAAEAPQSQQQLGAQPKPLGQLVIPNNGVGVPQDPGAPVDLGALAKGDPNVASPAPGGGDQIAPLVAQPSGDPATDYKGAYELFVSGQYAAAETSFRQFLQAYPGDPRAPDASYWLGQSLFSRGMYREAALEFVNGHKLYPKSTRAADTMLLLGKSLAGIPEREAACQTFAAALKQYPQMSNALRQRVITEQANAGC